MFRIYIYRNLNCTLKILIRGDEEIVRTLYESINKMIWARCIKYTLNKGTNQSQCAEFSMGIWNLEKFIEGSSIAQIILDFIKLHQIQVDERTLYLLHYWAFEVQMWRMNNSYRSSLFNRELTDSEKLNEILNQCKQVNYLPSPKNLFNLFEHSEAMKKNKASWPSQPPMPYQSEILVFINGETRNFAEIRKASRIIAQGARDRFCFFHILPREMNWSIAKFTGDPLIHDDEAAMNIAITHFGKPL